MKSQFEKEVKFCKFFLIFTCVTCGISAYIHRNDNDALIGLATFVIIFGGITLYAMIVRIKYLRSFNGTLDKGNKKQTNNR